MSYSWQSFYYPFQSYASFTVPLVGKLFFTDVKFTNPKNNKSVTVKNMLADTGAQYTLLDGTTYAKPLGLDIKSGIGPQQSVSNERTVTSYGHFLKVQVGELQPVLATVFVTLQKPWFNNLGWLGVLNKYRLQVEPRKLTYSDMVQSAMANAQGYWRNRI